MTITHWWPTLYEYPLGHLDPWKPRVEQEDAAWPEHTPAGGVYVFDGATSDVVHNIVLACALDPTTTTVSQLDELDPRVVCLQCAPRGQLYGWTMKWKRAVSHPFHFVSFCSLLYQSKAAPLAQNAQWQRYRVLLEDASEGRETRIRQRQGDSYHDDPL